MKIKTLKGLALQDILTQVHLYVHRGQAINLTYNLSSQHNASFRSTFDPHWDLAGVDMHIAFPDMHTVHTASALTCTSSNKGESCVHPQCSVHHCHPLLTLYIEFQSGVNQDVD